MNSTVTLDTRSCSGPTPVVPSTQPCNPVAMPGPAISTSADGLTPPGSASPPAPLKKLDRVICGPGRAIVSVKVAEKLPADAVTVPAPAEGPACTTTEACPLAPVVALAPCGNTTFVPVNCTVTPA